MEKRANKLISEKSPYLLQHCYNPVEWYPWGDEAFKRAKELNRPIFLSVGYSTCHWCHVMEHESFENEQIGKLMNENFVSIKVDREERPDVDKLYMSFVQATTGGGGWPMSVFLTPDLEPIVGGTYFPPKDSYGRPGFASILTMIANKWKTKQPEVQGQGRKLKDAICGAMKQKPVDESQQLPAAATTMQKLYDKFAATFDAKNGGFGGAPKFPKPVDLDFLLGYHVAMKKTDGEKAKKALSMVEKTLEKMAAGGIHDHVGKGFHRYSVDATWHVPHFEKMLYDQGQLLATYASICKLQAGRFEDVVVDIADYVRENLTNPKGGFYCAEDADSLPTADADKKKEGAFCVWTKGEIQEVLGDRPLRHNENITLDELACAVFQVQDGGNVSPASDPHGELKEQNVLKMVDKEKLEALASEYHLSLPQLAECIGDVKRFLAERRAQRPRPHLDNKILTSWNALAIEGLAIAAKALRVVDPTRAEGYQFMAQQAVEFVREHLSTGDEHEELLRAAYVDANQEVIKMRAPIHAFADDYAFLISALLALYETNFDEALLQWAQELQRIMDLLFWDTDSNSGYYLARADDPSIFARQQEDQDGAEPSTNSVAVYNLLRLHSIFGTKEYRQSAESIFRGAADRLEKFPIALPKMVTALNAHHNSFPEIVVVGRGRAAGSNEEAMLALIQSKFIPFKTLVFIDASRDDSWLVEKNERYKALVDVYKKDIKPAVYICKGNTCQTPIHALNELQTVLGEL